MLEQRAMPFNHIAVIGAGAWGSALALTCARAGRQVTLWEHDARNAAQLAKNRESLFLPGVRIDDSIVIAGDLAEAVRAQAILLVVPAQAVRAVATALTPLLAARTPVIVCAKGIERGTKKFMTEVIAECAPNAVPAILSGPSFAADVARGMPTAVTLAASDDKLAGELARAIGSASFRPYHSTDVRGVEIGGAAKNVLAIAAGIVNGRGLGASAAAALTTRGFAELVRFGRAYGAKAETMMGLSGLGDLLLTCSSPQSRNFTFGVNLGRGQKPEAIHAGLAEGVFTASVLVDMARERNVDMPIAIAVAALLNGTMTVDEAIEFVVDATVQGGGIVMAYWLMKTEPEEFSWDDQVKRGAKGEPWSGVRNFTARRHLKEMKKGEKFFFYHTGAEKQVVGIGEIIREAYPDPTAEKGEPWVAVTTAAVEPLPKPVTLAAIKAEPKLKDMALVKYARLSVQPVTAEEWKLVCRMGGVKA